MNPIRRYAVIAVTSGVAVASLALPGTAVAKAPTTNSPAAAAAGFLARQMSAHKHHLITVFQKKEYADDGATADAILSIDAAGAAQHEANLATAWLKHDAANYLGGSLPNIYPGAAAKLLLVATAQHVDPENFGGIDLVDAIVGTEGGGGAPAGEYQNPLDTDFSASVLVQSLAVLALATSPGATHPSASAVTFLSSQQCDNGAFQVAIRADTDTTPCTAADNDVDTTAYAIQALLAAGQHQDAREAANWLVASEQNNGGWGETIAAPAEANSTALAVEALVAMHRSAVGGLNWLHAHQQGCKANKAQRGAVRFQGKYTEATAIRATSQAGAALALRPLAWIDKNGATSAAPTLKC